VKSLNSSYESLFVENAKSIGHKEENPKKNEKLPENVFCHSVLILVFKVSYSKLLLEKNSLECFKDSL